MASHQRSKDQLCSAFSRRQGTEAKRRKFNGNKCKVLHFSSHQTLYGKVLEQLGSGWSGERALKRRTAAPKTSSLAQQKESGIWLYYVTPRNSTWAVRWSSLKSKSLRAVGIDVKCTLKEVLVLSNSLTAQERYFQSPACFKETIDKEEDIWEGEVRMMRANPSINLRNTYWSLSMSDTAL